MIHPWGDVIFLNWPMLCRSDNLAPLAECYNITKRSVNCGGVARSLERSQGATVPIHKILTGPLETDTFHHSLE
jgi:hypothetical protein